jgi:hypothetical protein
VECFRPTEGNGGLSVFFIPSLIKILIHPLHHVFLLLSEAPIQVGLHLIACPELELRFRQVTVSQTFNFQLAVWMGTVQWWMHDVLVVSAEMVERMDVKWSNPCRCVVDLSITRLRIGQRTAAATITNKTGHLKYQVTLQLFFGRKPKTSKTTC